MPAWSPPIQISARKLLIVEGRDEQIIFEELCRRLGVGGVQVIEARGKNRFSDRLPVITKLRGFSDVKAVVLMRDAEEDARSAFESLRSVLRSCGLPVPSAELQWVSGIPEICVMLLPPSQSSGCLE